jgi:hypothetical protein
VDCPASLVVFIATVAYCLIGNWSVIFNNYYNLASMAVEKEFKEILQSVTAVLANHLPTPIQNLITQFSVTHIYNVSKPVASFPLPPATWSVDFRGIDAVSQTAFYEDYAIDLKTGQPRKLKKSLTEADRILANGARVHFGNAETIELHSSVDGKTVTQTWRGCYCPSTTRVSYNSKTGDLAFLNPSTSDIVICSPGESYPYDLKRISRRARVLCVSFDETENTLLVLVSCGMHIAHSRLHTIKHESSGRWGADCGFVDLGELELSSFAICGPYMYADTCHSREIYVKDKLTGETVEVCKPGLTGRLDLIGYPTADCLYALSRNHLVGIVKFQ